MPECQILVSSAEPVWFCPLALHACFSLQAVLCCRILCVHYYAYKGRQVVLLQDCVQAHPMYLVSCAVAVPMLHQECAN